MMRTVILLFMLCPLLAAAQDLGVYRFPTSIPAAYKVDALAEYKRMSAEKYGRHKRRDIKRFAELVAYGKKQLITSGSIYLDPPLVEEYLDRLASRVEPDAPVKLYLSRDATYNAFAMHDGTLLINVGILAEMPNEAALASILGHEIAHYLNDDNRATFFNKLDVYTRKHRNSNMELRIDKAHDDRQMEHIADSLGFVLARRAGADIRYGVSNFLLLMEEEEHDEDMGSEDEPSDSSSTTSLDALLADHPATRDRIEFLENWLEENDTLSGGAPYIMDEQTFLQVRDMARKETLQVLLEEHEYPECMDRAFRFHLLEPEHPGHLYYLCESIRRYMYMLPAKETAGFLVNGLEEHYEEGQGVLEDLTFLVPDSLLRQTMDTSEYYVDGCPIFNTNREALEYFIAKAEKAGLVEVLLTKAMLYRHNDSIRDIALDAYLEKGGAASTFATAFRSNTLDKELRKGRGELLLLDEMDFIEDRVYGYRMRHVLAERKSGSYLKAVTRMLAKRFAGKTVVNISELKETDLRSFLAYEQVTDNMAIVEWMWAQEEYRILELRTNGDDNDHELEQQTTALHGAGYEHRRSRSDMKFYFIDPLYYEFLISKGYSTVEYIKIKSFDDKTRIAKNVLGGIFFMYPGYWTKRSENGSNRFAFNVDHMKFLIDEQELYMRELNVPYRMTRPNLGSVIFESIMTIEE